MIAAAARFVPLRGRRRCALTLAAAALMLATVARAEAESTQAVKIVGSPTALTIDVSSCMTTPVKTPPATVGEALSTEHCLANSGGGNTEGHPQIVGVGRLLVPVEGKDAAGAKLMYTGEDGQAVVLERCSAVTELRAPVAACIDGKDSRTASADASVSFPLRFALFAEESTRSLQGVLSVLSVKASEPALHVPVSATIDEGAEVRIDPSSIRLAANAWRKRAVKITLTGTGVGSLLARQAHPHERVLLHGSNDDAAEVTLGPFRFEHTGGRYATVLRATAPLRLVNEPRAGSYSGKVALSQLDTAGPSLDVTVDSHLPLWSAFLFVAVGVLAATLLAPFIAIRRRGRRLAEALRKTMSKYREVECILRRAGCLNDGDEVLWDLGDVLGTGEPSGVHSPSSISELMDQIDAERDDEDFNEDRQLVLDVTAHVSRWLRVAPAALGLRRVAEPGGDQIDAITATATASRVLQLHLRREPADVNAADDLVERILDQIRWHASYRIALNAAKRSGSEPLVNELEDIDSALLSSDVLTRTPAEQDVLVVRLDTVRAQLNPPVPPIVPFPNLGIPGQLDVDWNAPANRFTGWSLLDGTSFRKLKVESATRYSGGWERLTYGEWLWSIGFALVTSAVYTFTVYNDTWGSLKDVFTALVAGATGAVTLKIALPVFSSQRLRAVAKS